MVELRSGSDTKNPNSSTDGVAAPNKAPTNPPASSNTPNAPVTLGNPSSTPVIPAIPITPVTPSAPSHTSSKNPPSTAKINTAADKGKGVSGALTMEELAKRQDYCEK